MKKLLLSALCAVLLLLPCSCAFSGGQVQPPDESSPANSEPPSGEYPAAFGLFPYFDQTGRFGLVNTKGEHVLPVEYYSIYSLDSSDGSLVGSQAKNSGLFVVNKAVIGETYTTEEELRNAPVMYALVSPEGEFLTELEYNNIFRESGLSENVASLKGKIIGIKYNPELFECDYIGEDGAAAPIEDENIRAYYSTQYYGYGDANMTEQDKLPVLQQAGLPALLENGIKLRGIEPIDDGKFWGDYELQGKSHFALFNPDGTFAMEEVFSWGYRLNSQAMCVYNGDDQSFVYKNDGTPLIDTPCDVISQTDKYLFLRGGGKLDIYGIDNELIRQIPVEADESAGLTVAAASFDDCDLFLYNQDGKIKMLNPLTSEEKTLSLPIEGRVEPVQIYSKNGPVLVSLWNSDRSSVTYYLFDLDGKELYSSQDYLYFQYGYLIDSKFRYGEDRYGQYPYLFGLIGIDGKQVLPFEYSAIRLLAGNALQVSRGDWNGIIDLGGNWILKESAWNGLD
ncbi:MAG: WG repeat-containing protein [Oscillospiraceae bacterium]|jgi:hypothetical protein|nr:WG repeat-containing protein [Oscillospiraceae bacterium]